MEQSCDHPSVPNRTDRFVLKQRLIRRAREASAMGDLRRLLQGTKDLTEVETDTHILVVADDLLDRYGQPAAAGLMADLHPSKSIWVETVFEGEGDRMGFLCIGAGALELHVASIEAAEHVTVDVVAGMRRQTEWQPGIDWAKMADGTWTPNPAWRRRAKTWLDAHFSIRDLQPKITLRMRAEASYAMFSAFAALAILHSPLFRPASDPGAAHLASFVGSRQTM